MRAVRAFHSHGAVMGPYSLHLLHRCLMVLATGNVGNGWSSKRRPSCSRWIRNRWKPSAVRGHSRRRSSETQPASSNGRLRLCHNRWLVGCYLPSLCYGVLDGLTSTRHSQLGCAHGLRSKSFAPCCGRSGLAPTYHRLLTLDPLAAASGREAKGSWCLGHGHAGTNTF